MFHERIAVVSAAVRDPEGKVVAAASLLGLPGEFTLCVGPRFHRPLLRAVRHAGF